MTANFEGVGGAIAGCRCSVLWFGGRVTTNFGSGRGAIAGCHCSVLGGWRPTLGEWTWCHCSVPL